MCSTWAQLKCAYCFGNKKPFIGTQKMVIRDYADMKLLFTNDGDLQELGYHTHHDYFYRHEMETLREHVPSGAVVIDVGANIRIMAIVLSRLVGPLGKIYCFEPSGRTFRKLQVTIGANNLNNVEAFNLGCGDVEATMNLFSKGQYSGHSSMLSNDLGSSTQTDAEQVEIVALDTFVLPREQRIDFLKIDVEGYEPAVLRGARKLIEKWRPKIYIEFSSDYRQSVSQSVKLLKDYNYDFPEPDFSDTRMWGFNALAYPVESNVSGFLNPL